MGHVRPLQAVEGWLEPQRPAVESAQTTRKRLGSQMLDERCQGLRCGRLTTSHHRGRDRFGVGRGRRRRLHGRARLVGHRLGTALIGLCRFHRGRRRRRDYSRVGRRGFRGRAGGRIGLLSRWNFIRRRCLRRGFGNRHGTPIEDQHWKYRERRKISKRQETLPCHVGYPKRNSGLRQAKVVHTLSTGSTTWARHSGAAA